MSNQQQALWIEDESKIIAEDDFDAKDRELFAKLVSGEENRENGILNVMQPGQVLKGRIVLITKDFVIVDVGLKSEGVIPISEFEDPAEIVIDAEVEVLFDQAEGDNGQIVVSREKAIKLRKWEYIVNHCKEGSIVKGKVTRKVKGGLMVDIGVEAFLPGSQIDNKKVKGIDEFLEKTIEVKILKINVDRKNIVVSRRELIEDERVSKKAEMLDDIQVGDIKMGVVKNITDFGVFLDLDGIDGLLHITDMAWKRLRHPSELVKLGDELEVMILSVDKEKGRVALGLKQKEANPWDEIEAKYPVGSRVRGKIVNLVPYGAFIELEHGIEGLIHVSEMSWVKNVTEPSQIVNRGDEVEAVVLSISKEDGKISLGLKQTEENPWDSAESKYYVGKVVTVEIRNLTNYGAFVELEAGVDGLIHISDLSWTKKVSHPSELLKKGDFVEAVILSIDVESKKITLGVKQLTENPWQTIEETMAVGSVVRGQISKITAFGAFVELPSGIDGLVHVSELSDKPFAKIEDVVKVGSYVDAKVVKVDPEHKKIALSIKEFELGNSKSRADSIVLEGQKKN